MPNRFQFTGLTFSNADAIDTFLLARGFTKSDGSYRRCLRVGGIDYLITAGAHIGSDENLHTRFHLQLRETEIPIGFSLYSVYKDRLIVKGSGDNYAVYDLYDTKPLGAYFRSPQDCATAIDQMEDLMYGKVIRTQKELADA